MDSSARGRPFRAGRNSFAAACAAAWLCFFSAPATALKVHYEPEELEAAFGYAGLLLDRAEAGGPIDSLNEFHEGMKKLEVMTVDVKDPEEVARIRLTTAYLYVKALGPSLTRRLGEPLLGNFGSWTPSEEAEYYFQAASDACKSLPLEKQGPVLFRIALGRFFELKQYELLLGSRPERLFDAVTEALEKWEKAENDADERRVSTARAIKNDLLYGREFQGPLDLFRLSLDRLIYGEEMAGGIGGAPEGGEIFNARWRYALSLPGAGWKTRESVWPAYRLDLFDPGAQDESGEPAATLYVSPLGPGGDREDATALFDAYMTPIKENVNVQSIEKERTTVSGRAAVSATVRIGPDAGSQPADLEPREEKKGPLFGPRPYEGKKKKDVRKSPSPRTLKALYLINAGLQYALIFQAEAQEFQESLDRAKTIFESFSVF